eukprot:TRINITY_DN62226_c0_g1_i1.p1 TRINITY_DN62226_c0_g1~~TRINITY_DN62226_c0_g1_i1.p1  ORF type:complete len:954 (-),score=77.92 TRINITY_DN62226_c0_g1_i1:85-2757(-)
MSADRLTLNSCYEMKSLQNYSVEQINCPRDCAFASVCDYAEKVQCVRESDCTFWDDRRIAYNGSADDSGLYCVDCRIPGCKSCSERNVCEVCDTPRMLEDGKCYSNQLIWLVLSLVMVCLGLWVLVDLCVTARRKVRNKESLEAGLSHRSRCHLRDHSKEGRPMHGFFAPVHTKPIGGPGMALFFNWFILQGIVALWLAVVSFSFNSHSSWQSPKTHDQFCIYFQEMDNPVVDIPTIEGSLILWTGLSYFGALLISAIFLVMQHKHFDRLIMCQDMPLLQSYALFAQGFPPDAVDHEELEEYWRDVLKHHSIYQEGDVAEVSIAYAFYNHQTEITSLTDQHLREAGLRKLRRRNAATAIANFDFTPSGHGYMPGGAEAGSLWTQLIAWFLIGTDMHFWGRKIRGFTPAEEAPSVEGSKELLDGLRGSGVVIVVLQRAELVRDLIAQSKPHVCLQFKGSLISIQPMTEEPQGVLWENIGTPQDTKCARVFKIGLLTFVVGIVWILLFFFWARFAIITMGDSSPFSSIGLLVIGCSTILGNAMLGVFSVFITSYYGFVRASSRDKVYLRYIVLANILMVNVSDLIIVIYMSGQKMGDNFAPTLGFSYGLSVAMGDLYTLLIPMYVLVPYIGEPFASVFLPYWIGILRIMGDVRITPEHAERLLLAGEMDIINTPYNDMIAITTQFMMVFLAPAGIHTRLFLWLLFQTCLTYVLARWRFTRWQTATTVGTNRLHTDVSYLWAIPLGLLAANFGFHVSSNKLQKIVFFITFFIAHLVLHVCFVTFVLPATARREQFSATRFSEAVRKTMGPTYVNTNAVEVLKRNAFCQEGTASNAFGAVMPEQKRLVLYRIGKEDLQPGSEQKYYDLDAKVWSPQTLVEELSTEIGHAHQVQI